MNDQNNAMNELVAALDGHEITDDQGQIEVEQETIQEEPTASEEKTTVEESATAEKPAESESEAPQAEEDETEIPLAEDETGKRYVPEPRFKKVYGKLKDAERRAQAAEAKLLMQQPTVTPTTPSSTANQAIDKTEALEIELLKGKLPQFDPESDSYSEILDQWGADIYEASKRPDPSGKMVHTITRLEAAKQALKKAEKLASESAHIKAEARLIKSSQADQGITSRVVSRESAQVDPTQLSLEEKEKWLKEHGQW